jgi:hypothetical protein
MESQLDEKQSQETTKEASEKEKRSLAKKTGHLIKNRTVSYFRNLDPRGKDKFWWTGNLLSATASAGLFLFAPAARPLKTLASVALSTGLYSGERVMDKYRERYWTEERIAERAAKRQEKFPNGTSRLKRFLLGVSAGSLYGAAVGLPLEIVHSHLEAASVKHAQRHYERPTVRASH